MTITTPVEYLPLSPGVAVSMDCVRLSWQLEDRGLIVDLDEDNRLVVLPDEVLTADERRAVSRHRGELVTLVRYCRDVVVT